MPAFAPELARRFGGLGSAFWWLQLGLFLNRSGQFVQPLLTFWLTGVHGLTVTRAGMVVAVYGLGSTLGTALGGLVADRVGRRTALLISAVGSACALVALASARHVSEVVPGAFALALLYDLHRPAVQAMVADVVAPADRVRAYALTYVTINLAFAFAPALAGWLAGYSYDLVFGGAAIVQLLWGAFVAVRVPETRPTAPPGRTEHGFGPVLRDRVFVLWLGALALAAMVPHQGFVALSAWMKHEGYAPSTYGSVVAVNGLLIVLIQPWVAERISRRDPIRVFIASALLQGIGFSMHGLGLGVPGHVAAVAVWTAGEIVAAPVTSAVVADLAPPELRGRYQGLVAMAFAAASTIAPMLGAAAIDAWGRVFWVACMVVGALAACCMALLGPSLRARRAAARSAA
jgi:MFS family permease